MNLFARGQKMLNRHLAAAAGVDVEYRRQARTCRLTAWAGRGQEDTKQPDPTGQTRIDFGVRDWLFPLAELTFGEGEVEPAKGDVIVVKATGECFEVLPMADSKCWRWSDHTRITARVHTKPAAPDACHP